MSPREWRQAFKCHITNCLDSRTCDGHPCTCGLSAVHDAIEAGHRVVVGPEGVEGRLDGWPVSDASEWSTTRVVPLEEEP